MKVYFSERLKELREEKGISQKDLGDVFHVSRTTIYHWETGKQQPSLEMLADIALYFEVTVGYLLGVED